MVHAPITTPGGATDGSIRHRRRADRGVRGRRQCPPGAVGSRRRAERGRPRRGCPAGGLAVVNRPDAHVVVRSDHAPDADEVAEPGRRGGGGPTGPRTRPLPEYAVIAGRAATVLSHPGANLVLRAAVGKCRPGDVVIVSTSPDNSGSTNGMFGEPAVSMRSRVRAGAVSAQGTVEASPGPVNVP